ncbi:MAG: VWA domain-containing protein [Candidatus Hydrogenedentes bacterium]|nr:VWA domain-containing protein [Candidatus Hydrogenedentota bacterium]
MSLFNAFTFSALMYPSALILLLGVLLLCVAECMMRAPGALNISTGETLWHIRGHQRAALRRVPALLRAFGLAMLVIALARPMQGLSPQKDSADIVDVMLCVDVSGSMRAMDFRSRDELLTRLDVTKEAVRDFIQSRKNKPEDRYGLDRLGLVLYAKYAWTQTPLTLDYAVLERDLENAQIDSRDRSKQGTAIGSAIGLAVSKLRKSEAKNKVIILLTDGRNNEGELDPITAAHLAKEYGIRIYTIGAGSSDQVVVPVETLFGTRPDLQSLPIDEDTLKQIAEISGARFYRATDLDTLHSAYDEINQLETTKVELGDYYEYKEAFVPWAAVGTLALLGSVFSRRFWFESIP